ncbi:MAG: HDOD domain-containing protein [Paucibacter sp.]|nr:HDOD domain-containing protein [Roseateles sp.]
MSLQQLTRPLPTLAAWTQHFRKAEIPVLAETADALELMRANEDAVDANRLGEMIANDPLMTLKVLSHAAEHRSQRLLADAETVTAALVLMGITPFFRKFGPQPIVEDLLATQPEALVGLNRVLSRANRAARYALAFAAHRADPDAAILHSAALLHDFAEMLMWVHAPALAIEMRQRQQADKTLRSVNVQREVLNIELGDLEQELMQVWRLPALLKRITNDKHARDLQVRCVKLAVQLARHTADGWENAAVPDDLAEIGELLQLNPQHTLKLLHEYD